MEKYLIVGLGSIGKRHLSNLRLLRPTAQIGVLRLHSIVSDSDIPQEADAQFTSLTEALAFAPLAAIIASPASTHIGIGRALADIGAALFIEKPIAHTVEGIPELLQRCVRSGLPLMVGYNLRFLPSLQKCKQLIGAGAIGKVLAARAEVGQYLPDWRPGTRYQNSVSAQRALGGGALLELSHELDYLYWLFGMPQRVSACGGKYSSLEIDVEDVVSISLEYAMPNRLVEIHLDFLQHAATRTCKFIGEQGILFWNGITDEITIFQTNKKQWVNINCPTNNDRNQMYIDELQHFLACIHDKKQPICDGAQALDVLKIVGAASMSMQTGCRISTHDMESIQ